MKIAVIFTGCDGTDIPEGISLVFEDVAEYDVSTPRDIEDIGCADADCEGCTATHRRVAGVAHLKLSASGPAPGAQWIRDGA